MRNKYLCLILFNCLKLYLIVKCSSFPKKKSFFLNLIVCPVLSDYLNNRFFFFSLTYLKTLFHIPDFDTVAPWLGKKVICNFKIDFSVIFALLCLFNTCQRWSEAVCVCSGSCWRKEPQNISAASSRHLWAADLSDIDSRLFDFLQECCETPLDLLCLQEINAALLICREARFTLAGHFSCVCALWSLHARPDLCEQR